MARRYANMSTDRWMPGSKYTRLSMNAQWVDYVLSTQSEISAVGVLSLNVKRWATRAEDATPANFMSGLQELQSAGVLVYDTVTEEVLRRGFVKEDGGYNNRKRRPVIERAAQGVESTALRAALAEDFAEVGLPVEWLALPDTDDPVAARASSTEKFPQVDSLSDGQSPSTAIAHAENPDGASRSQGVVVTQEGVVRPQPSTPLQQPLPPSAAAPPAATATALVRNKSLINGMPAAEATVSEPTTNQRAFGLARTWIAERQDQGTPVVVPGRQGPLHALRCLIKPFLDVGYTDEEVLQELRVLGVSLPAKGQLDNALTRSRRRVTANRQGRSAERELERRGTYGTPAPATGLAAPRESTQVRKSRRWGALREELDRMNPNGGSSDAG